MTKRTVFTTITPLPANISRAAAISFLHNHVEMIDLNPLIIERHPIEAPDNCPNDERKCIWYSLTDKISYLPGGVMSGEVSYTCAFHDLPDGLQTHCYAPMGLDIRDKWTVAGSLPGERQEPVELGLGAPHTGLYIREDVDIRCNVLMSGFVKKTLKKAHATLVDHLSAKAKSMARKGSGDSYGSGSGPLSYPRSRSESRSRSGLGHVAGSASTSTANYQDDRARLPSANSSRRSSPRSSHSHTQAPGAPGAAMRGQSPHSQIAQNAPSGIAIDRRQSPHSQIRQHSASGGPGAVARGQSPHSLSSAPGGAGVRRQSPPSIVTQDLASASHIRSASAGSQPPRYQLPPQQQMQQPYQDLASWRATDVPRRMGTQYVGNSRPQDYADFMNMNPYDNDGPIDQSAVPPPLQLQVPQQQHQQLQQQQQQQPQYRPYTGHNSSGSISSTAPQLPPLPVMPSLAHHRHHLAELE